MKKLELGINVGTVGFICIYVSVIYLQFTFMKTRRLLSVTCSTVVLILRLSVATCLKCRHLYEAASKETQKNSVQCGAENWVSTVSTSQGVSVPRSSVFLFLREALELLLPQITEWNVGLPFTASAVMVFIAAITHKGLPFKLNHLACVWLAKQRTGCLRK